MTESNLRVTCCGLNLRIKCFIIGYLNLLASVVDIACHVLTVAIVTNGFQCDIDNESLQLMNVPWLEPILLMLNLGTHGFYPFPRIFRNQYNVYIDYIAVTAEPKCYPGMLHVYLVDVLNFLINVIWLKIVISYVSALHKRNPEPMRMFFTMSLIKLIMQMMYFGYQPAFHDVFTIEFYWLLKLLDIYKRIHSQSDTQRRERQEYSKPTGMKEETDDVDEAKELLISIAFLIIVKRYADALRALKAPPAIEQPPSYIECLINSSASINCNKATTNDDTIIPVEEKKPVEAVKP